MPHDDYPAFGSTLWPRRRSFSVIGHIVLHPKIERHVHSMRRHVHSMRNGGTSARVARSNVVNNPTPVASPSPVGLIAAPLRHGPRFGSSPWISRNDIYRSRSGNGASVHTACE